jgi:MFS family permease
MWGRLSDVVGRKNILYPGIIIFAFGSAMCGASQSMNMLIGECDILEADFKTR